MSLSVETIIERIGGAEKIALLTGVGTEAVRKWRQARAIPPKHWPVVARASGVSIDDLQPAGSGGGSVSPEFSSSDQKRDSMMSEHSGAVSGEIPLGDIPEGATAALVLADGTVLWGLGFGAPATGEAIGEICFSTGMTGYQETLTDPSFAGQIITFTFPHIGNVGANPEDDEASRVSARGLVVKQDLTEPANWRAAESLDAWLKERGVPGICGVDTRALTLRIRDQGPQTAVLGHVVDGRLDVAALKKAAVSWPGLEGMDLAKVVTCEKRYGWSQGVWEWPSTTKALPAKLRRVVAVDYGAKRNILRCLATAGCDVTVVPATTSAEEILALKPEGVFLSNGPGDPAATASYAVPAIRGVLDAGVPVFGICLGHQLLALALGGKTYKLERGHRGANQPVKDLATGRVEITSQNHGFAVDEASLPNEVRVTHVSLFDKSNEGIASNTLPAFSVQYHPEASPGPSDSFYLFERFVAMMDANQAAGAKAG
ncbi:glutamine-hydrolyzing carbamoyl-phosphate synthase small subunit [Acetobacter fallax]|uniref:Carbamoyl phosphate synthase small chain n=1 Tax=Acetobacter fallax TaxID=1737473 RepID=A0ABX0K5L5_9PROT|nr:glutamine-hydrolyzing carbamoyl-phosphate synthase small subunit [Acetobacter fallax]NHO31675.1 glutamine-hydrolyzing carbamoyl-phosphate synthase small subunit [Acetobacter fallax]NHO35234.1 glutamine-hydrolyzing carbamoyl-phosphate synthase small subunit [Acetobacter fallax]